MQSLNVERCSKNPEFGYKEFKTSERIKKEFEKLGIPYESELAITGVKGTIGKKDANIKARVFTLNKI